MAKESAAPSKPAEAEDPGLAQLLADARAVFAQSAEARQNALVVPAPTAVRELVLPPRSGQQLGKSSPARVTPRKGRK